ncbi:MULTISPECIES: hypothetical protein [Gordonia]|uniref:Uncharacterized protein n=1 Tax=Gordonia amicalis TaxID=89053 RepID=A0AAE4RAM2_9ACTN|nr:MULTISPECIES: hypothetical protein [Gordonia]KAF0967534.1 hypothetical protein BPODLACK_03895 [Gordonia sp. YY1]MCR8898700.1 hypothetical protein [Gordonia sp. GONU]MCZ0914958.1 hypothetical protein [Gordonia amicalis]MCZ4579103.1 hypothetical protein [Gordonia amicalis]MCZ4652646.1 hypothetical protein [Gordonia amicalis]
MTSPPTTGVLLSVFAVLLLAFGADFHFSRRIAKRHKLSARIFMTVNVSASSPRLSPWS